MHRDKKQNVIAIFYLKVKNNSEYVFFSTNEVFTNSQIFTNYHTDMNFSSLYTSIELVHAFLDLISFVVFEMTL